MKHGSDTIHNFYFAFPTSILFAKTNRRENRPAAGKTNQGYHSHTCSE